MTWSPRPIPEVTPETERFWSAATDNRLLLSECRTCDLVFYYPRALCPDCFGDTFWYESTGTGEVYTYTVMDQIEGWPEDDLPSIQAYVELDEGPRVLTNLVDCTPEEVMIGASVEVTFVPTDSDDIAVPVFRLKE